MRIRRYFSNTPTINSVNLGGQRYSEKKLTMNLEESAEDMTYWCAICRRFNGDLPRRPEP